MAKFTFNFELPCKAVAKGRPRMTRSGLCYTPKATKEFEKYVDLFCCQAMQERGIETIPKGIGVSVKINFVFVPTKTELKNGDFLFRPFLKKPDVDNLAKSILDGMNGELYEDDSQVYSLSTSKIYGKNDYVYINATWDTDL